MTGRSEKELFIALSRQELMLRAPTRKRKPPDESDGRLTTVERPRVQAIWDLDTETTDDIYSDMGVSLLADDECLDMSIDAAPEPTPAAPSQPSDLIAPGAPRFTIPPHPQANLSLGSSLNLGPSCNGSAFTQFSSYTLVKPHNSSLAQRHSAPGEPPCNFWETLSDEMALCVFRWLSKSMLVRCARVCKRFYRLSLDETLWRRIDLSNKTLRPGVVGTVLDRGAAVVRFAKTELKIPLFKAHPNSSFNQYSRLSKLQYLDLSMAVVSPQGLEEILATCQLLRKLSLENCHINDSVCGYIGQNRNLEVLNLCMCEGLTENGLVPICNNLQSLDALNVGWTEMSRGAVVYLVICLPQCLTKLNLSGCRETLLDEDVEQLCGSCPGLKELDLSDCTLLTHAAVDFIRTQLGSLEYIALSRCYHIMPSCLPLLSNLKSLLALDVFGMLKEAVLLQLKEVMPGIEINKFPFSSIARPTTGIRRTSIWGLRVRDSVP